jgi:5-methylcytosine-specific restriction protein A
MPGVQCSNAGCPNLSGGGLCDECKQLRSKDRRSDPGYKQSKAFYDSKKWKKIRNRQLNKYPLCERCLGMGDVVRAAVVDHIVPWKGDRSLAIDPDNLQSLCVSCHNAKSATER